MMCRCPITCVYPIKRYMNTSHLFSKMVVFILLEKASTLEICTISTPPFCFASMIIILHTAAPSICLFISLSFLCSTCF
uniref:Uncharacterized protein n=1 Tax=Setaria italica TaxID=4555 RepID=K3YBB7_SETIT